MEALNNLESYMYKLRDVLSDESTYAAFYRHSVPTERKKLQYLLDQTFVFMDKESEKAASEKLLSKHRDLQCVSGHKLFEKV